MASKLWQDWVILVAAFWLFLSPFVLGFAALSHAGAWLAWLGALALFVSASEALVLPDAIEEWVDGSVGIALIASPWLLGFSENVMISLNFVATGVVVAVCAISALIRDRKMGARHSQGDHSAAH